MSNTNTGTIFANLSKPGVYSQRVGEVELVVTEIGDKQLGIEFGDHKDTLTAQFSQFGKMYLCTLPVNGGTKYIVSQRENNRGKFVMFKIAKNQGDNKTAAPAPAQYGAR